MYCKVTYGSHQVAMRQAATSAATPSNRGEWLHRLDELDVCLAVNGLVLVKDYRREGRPPEEVAVMEKAASYDAHSVFFRAAVGGRPPQPEAFIYVADQPDDSAFAALHRRLWSWGGVPLIYRKTPGLIQLFRCGHKPDFVSDSGEIVCSPAKTLELATRISADPWWDASRLRNGSLWDDPEVCRELLSRHRSANRSLISAVETLSEELHVSGILPKHLRRRLLILSLLIAYLEDRGVLQASFFGAFLTGAERFFEVIGDGNALVELLGELEERFNGNVFSLDDEDRDRLRGSGQLGKFAKLIQGHEEKGGQRTLWKLYSFRDLPVELISHIYQLFVKDADSSVYTPPFLVRLMLEESLGWERLTRIQEQKEVVLDPCCGSGVFLVEAYKRMILHWRSVHEWRQPTPDELRSLLQGIRGVDLEPGAIELAAFSLCLALCDALPAEIIRDAMDDQATKLFPKLVGHTLHESCFFDALTTDILKAPIGAIVGNPPFDSSLPTSGAKASYARYKEQHGILPDKQLAYLFLHESVQLLTSGGVLCLLQQYNFLYNQQSEDFRKAFFEKWDVREVLDFVSVRGLFQKGQADTKVLVVLAEAGTPPSDRQILHATFRRTGRVDAEQGFDIDYYDLHWLPRSLVLTNDGIWRSDLLGGGRVLSFVDRLKDYCTLGGYAKARAWDHGEGFIEGQSGKLLPAEHLTGHPLLPSEAITTSGVDTEAIITVTARKFKSSYTESRFSPPMLLIREQMDLPHVLWTESYLTYKNKVVGLCAPEQDIDEIRSVDAWVTAQKRTLCAYAAATSVRLFTQKATTLSGIDILTLPYPESGSLDLSPNESIVVDDVVDHYRDLIRLGEDSAAMKQSALPALADFTEVYSRQINAVYKNLTALAPQAWPGAICQPFVFGAGDVDWSGAEELRGRLDSFLHEDGPSLHVTRIARIYDRNFVFLLKPDRLRYWLRSVALRDADETIADLRKQGF